MMKRTMGRKLWIVTILFCCIGAMALAEAPRALDWVDYEKVIDEGEIPAAFYSLGDTGMMMWVPVSLSEVELSEEDRAELGEDTVSVFATEDGSAYVYVTRLEGDADMTMAEVQSNVLDIGVTSAEMMTVNGLEAMSFPFEPDDELYLIVKYGPGMYLQFVFGPASNPDFLTLASAMAASIQAENMNALEQQGLVNDRFLEKTISWEDVKDSAAEVDPNGQFAQIGDWNFCMWLPSVFTPYELTQEQVDSGISAILGTPDGSGLISITETAGTEATLEEWRDALISIGCEDAEIAVVNGIRAVLYSDKETDSLNVMYCVEDSGETMQFTFSPISNEGYAAVATLMVSSLQAIE